MSNKNLYYDVESAAIVMEGPEGSYSTHDLIDAMFDAFTYKSTPKIEHMAEALTISVTSIITGATKDDIENTRVMFVGRHGIFNKFRAVMREMPKEERPVYGRFLNACVHMIKETVDCKLSQMA